VVRRRRSRTCYWHLSSIRESLDGTSCSPSWWKCRRADQHGRYRATKKGFLGINGLLKAYGGLQLPSGVVSGTPQAGYVLSARKNPVTGLYDGTVEWAPGGASPGGELPLKVGSCTITSCTENNGITVSEQTCTDTGSAECKTYVGPCLCPDGYSPIYDPSRSSHQGDVGCASGGNGARSVTTYECVLDGHTL
jgi:hypothetical protein